MSRTSSDDDTNEEHGDMKDEDAVVDYMALLSVVNLAKVVFRLFYFKQELRTNAQLLLLKGEEEDDDVIVALPGNNVLPTMNGRECLGPYDR